METIGAQLRAARKAKGLTQEMLAEALNMSRQGISHWEQGRTVPDAEMLLRLSKVLEYNFESSHSFVQTSNEILPPAEEPSVSLTAEPEEVSVPEAVMSAAADEVPLVSAPNAPKRKKRWWIMAGLLGAAVLLCASLFFLLPSTGKPEVAMEILEDKVFLQYVPSYFGGDGYGWIFTLSIHNDSDIPLRPKRVVVCFYTNERINSKLVQPYEEIQPWMDSDLLHKNDTPLHLLYATNTLETTRAECILYATDPSGEEHIYTTSVPLLQ